MSNGLDLPESFSSEGLLVGHREVIISTLTKAFFRMARLTADIKQASNFVLMDIAR
jgi:hypothetical protein